MGLQQRWRLLYPLLRDLVICYFQGDPKMLEISIYIPLLSRHSEGAYCSPVLIILACVVMISHVVRHISKPRFTGIFFKYLEAPPMMLKHSK